MPSDDDAPPGVIFVLKNCSDSVNIDNQNRLYPFYMVYISDDGEVICNHLSPKQLLDKMRHLCKGKTEPIPSVYKPLNKETRDGKNMEKYSELLKAAVESIVEVKDESDIDSLFQPGETTLLSKKFSDINDFELVSFLIIKAR